MSGHSKWSNIQHRKKAQDARRGKLFTRLLREVTVASRDGNPDADANPRLRLAIEKASAANVSKENILRAIKRGAKGKGGDDCKEIRYEGYGPGNVAVLVDCFTDNRNRASAAIRNAFSRHGGKLVATGSVAFLFRQVGVIAYSREVSEDHIVELAIDAGAEDVVIANDCIEVIARAENFNDVKQRLEKAEIEPQHVELVMRADVEPECDDETRRKVDLLIEAIEDLEDVRAVWSAVSS